MGRDDVQQCRFEFAVDGVPVDMLGAFPGAAAEADDSLRVADQIDRKGNEFASVVERRDQTVAPMLNVFGGGRVIVGDDRKSARHRFDSDIAEGFRGARKQEQIRSRVTVNYQQYQAAVLARNAGTMFATNAAAQLLAGKTFAQVAVAAGHPPVTLSPFSLSSSEVPEAGDRAQIGQLKQVAFATPAGKLSSFVPTADGGFVLFVKSLLPVDPAKKKTDLTDFTSQVRRARQNEAFNLWLQAEAGRELRSTPVYSQLTGAKVPAK